VKCLVRNLRKASFLKEWGADLVYGDLCIPQSLPNTLKGVTCIIDASTTRPYEFLTSEAVDWVGKNNLLKLAKKAKIKKYVFLSILNGHKKDNIPFMELKLRFERKLLESGISYTIFYLPSLFQGIISQYAVSILDQQTIVVPTNSENKMMYIDARDIADSVVNSLALPLEQNRRIPLITNENWTPQEIIQICEKYCGQKAKTLYTPNLILQFFSSFFKLFQWSWSLSEQLTFVNSTNIVLDGLYIKKVNTSEYNTLEGFLKDYFSVMLKKLKELNIKKSESPIF
jgi:nucleoside-diphosphate-sugar epimerase